MAAISPTCAWCSIKNPFAERLGHRPGIGVDEEFPVDTSQVGGDRILTDPEAVRDLLLEHPLSEETENLQFPWCEAVVNRQGGDFTPLGDDESEKVIEQRYIDDPNEIIEGDFIDESAGNDFSAPADDENNY